MRVAETCTDVRGEGQKKRLWERDRITAALSDKCRTTCVWVRECADEARRRRQAARTRDGQRPPPQTSLAADRCRRTGHGKGEVYDFMCGRF
eukprot:scaffold67699_cov63-Phaeocystis_antarctica.AAC.3